MILVEKRSENFFFTTKYSCRSETFKFWWPLITICRWSLSSCWWHSKAHIYTMINWYIVGYWKTERKFWIWYIFFVCCCSVAKKKKKLNIGDTVISFSFYCIFIFFLFPFSSPSPPFPPVHVFLFNLSDCRRQGEKKKRENGKRRLKKWFMNCAVVMHALKFYWMNGKRRHH